VDREDIAFYNYGYIVDRYDVIVDFSHQHILSRKHNDLPTMNIVWHNMDKPYPKASYNIVALSEWQRKAFENLYKQKARVLPVICVNPKRYSLKKEKGHRFLHLGKMSPEKGVLEAIRFSRELGVGLDIIGGLGPKDSTDFRDYVLRLCDGEQIEYYGDVNDQVKIELIQNAKAILNPRRQDEAHWHVGAEAAMCSTPVVCFNHSSYPEVVKDGVSGFLVKSDDEFKNAMMTVHRLDPEKIHEFAMERYDRSKVVSSWIPIMKEVAEGLRW
jgi:glycosyltransferase involved in cell wall biosynthesis